MSKNKAEAPVKEEAPEEDVKMAEPEIEKKAEKKKGRLLCRLAIRGEEQEYKAGDEYKGKRAKYLLSRGAIYKE